LEVFASGLRNPYALTVAPDGRLLTIVQGEDHRGSRPMHAPDSLYEVRQGSWYGWPDYAAGTPVTELMQHVEMDNPKAFVLENHPPVEQPLYSFQDHCSAVWLEFSSSTTFGYHGEAFVAQYGAEQPVTTGGKFIFPGQMVSRLNLDTLREEDFYLRTSRSPAAPCPNRPVLTRFSPDGETLYLLDHGLRTLPKSGALWQIRRE
jgi:glucose/arabinose dehydrogenase